MKLLSVEEVKKLYARRDDRPDGFLFAREIDDIFNTLEASLKVVEAAKIQCDRIHPSWTPIVEALKPFQRGGHE